MHDFLLIIGPQEIVCENYYSGRVELYSAWTNLTTSTQLLLLLLTAGNYAETLHCIDWLGSFNI